MQFGSWNRRAMPFVAALGAIVALPAAAADEPPAKAIGQLRELGAAADRNDCEGVLRIGEPLLGQQPHVLATDVEAAVYELVANCAYSKGTKQKAYNYALRGSQLDASSDDLWHLRLWLEIDAKNYDAAVTTVEQMSAGRGAALNTTPSLWIWELQSQLKNGARRDQRKRLLKVLSADSYAPEDASDDAQGLHFQYAILLAEDGDAEGARAILRRVTDPGLLTNAMFDPRLHELLSAKVDLRASAEVQLRLEREVAARHPDRLDTIVNMASDLRRLGRPQEALALLQSVSGQIDDPSAFKDRDDKLSWYWDALGRTYAALGRYDDAVPAFRKGISAGEHGGLNVSQTINLADAQIRFGRGEDALKTLAGFDDPKRGVSAYGYMEMHVARGCAEVETGRPDAAAADLAYAQTHEKDDPEALSSLYICLGKLDEAAGTYIRRLGDPEKRAAALRALSDYDDPPVKVPPPPFEARWKALKARPDVRAAIERAGGTRHIPLQPDEI